MHTQYTRTVLGGGLPGAKSSAILFAGAPGAPTAAPRRAPASGSTSIAVEFDAVAVTNGAGILAYHSQIDDGLGGAFAQLQGDSLALSATKSTGIVRGRYYRVRYRARNTIGSGAFSPTAYILAADPPTTSTVAGAGSQLSAAIQGPNLVV